MSGWLTPKLVRTKKLRGFPWAVPQAREEVNTQLGVKTHDPDAGTPRDGQLRAEEVQGCKMSGGMTPQLVSTEKIRGFPWAAPQAREEVNMEWRVKNSDTHRAQPGHWLPCVDKVLAFQTGGWRTPKVPGDRAQQGVHRCRAPGWNPRADGRGCDAPGKARHSLLQEALSGWERRRVASGYWLGLGPGPCVYKGGQCRAVHSAQMHDGAGRRPRLAHAKPREDMSTERRPRDCIVSAGPTHRL